MIRAHASWSDPCLPRSSRRRRGIRAGQTATTNVNRASGLQHDLEALVAAGAPGAILFVRDGERTTILTAGLGDIARKTPMRADNHFKIASVTKPFTATVVLQLVGEGKLRLDDTIDRHLPGLVPNGSRITVRQLLNHTSGLHDFEDNPRYLKPYLNGDFAHYWSPRQLVQMGVSQKPLFAPGTRLLVLEHELRRRPADRGEDHREASRCRVEAPDLPAAAASRHELPDEAARPAEPLRARLHAARKAASYRCHRPQSLARAGERRDRLHRPRRRRLLSGSPRRSTARAGPDARDEDDGVGAHRQARVLRPRTGARHRPCWYPLRGLGPLWRAPRATTCRPSSARTADAKPC